MTLVLRNMPVYRFRYVDTNGMERFAVLYKGQTTDHLNISDHSIGLLKRLVVGIGGEPHPVFTEVNTVATVTAPVIEKVADPVVNVTTTEAIAEAIAESPAAVAKPVAKKSKPKPKAKAKKPTVNS